VRLSLACGQKEQPPLLPFPSNEIYHFPRIVNGSSNHHKIAALLLGGPGERCGREVSQGNMKPKKVSLVSLALKAWEAWAAWEAVEERQ
jgi:hypothetical protein